MADLLSREPIPRHGTWRRPLLTLAALAAIAATCAIPGPSQRADAQAGQARRAALELDGGTGWLGTDRPLSLKALRGKIVILEFWTSC